MNPKLQSDFANALRHCLASETSLATRELNRLRSIDTSQSIAFHIEALQFVLALRVGDQALAEHAAQSLKCVPDHSLGDVMDVLKGAAKQQPGLHRQVTELMRRLEPPRPPITLPQARPQPLDSGRPIAPPVAGTVATQGGNTLGTLSTVFGALGVLLSCGGPYTVLVGLPLGLAGLVLGIIGLIKEPHLRVLSIIGICLSGCSLLLYTISLILFIWMSWEAFALVSPFH
ncbi:MAG: hypothetical protein FJ247_11260 [Nitrospira sp.]|nr:hypothetical protein [Nitrospira sp.]